MTIRFCSQCGRCFGPGAHGFSHCSNHAGLPAVHEPLAPMNGKKWVLL